MKNLFLLMAALLIVNVTVMADGSMEGMGNTDDKTTCSMINGNTGADSANGTVAPAGSTSGSSDNAQ